MFESFASTHLGNLKLMSFNFVSRRRRSFELTRYSDNKSCNIQEDSCNIQEHLFVRICKLEHQKFLQMKIKWT